MGVVVRKSSSEVVRPPPEAAVTTTDHISLSPFDKIVACLPVTLFLVFDGPIHEPAETIKRALSKALVHYLPFSGRLAAGPGPGELLITAMGEGVPFVAAAASCALKDVKFSEQPPLVDELAILYPGEFCGLDDPLLMMQVTEFWCGGFVIGVTLNHAITDGAGLGQFLGAVGELARGLSSPSVVPIRSDVHLLRGPPAWIGHLMELVKSLKPVEVAPLDINVPSRVISGIKEEYRLLHSSPCTTFEAVTALMWQCRTRAMGLSNPEDPVAIAFTVDARRYVGAPNGYYGNCLTAQVAVATRAAVANGHLVDLVEMIRHAKSQIADQFDSKQQQGGDAEAQQDLRHLLQGGYNLFLVTSWRNLGQEEVDFGGGRPVLVTRYAHKRVILPDCVVCPGIDGSNLVRSFFVTELHTGAFVQELSARSSKYCLHSRM